jgi:conjugative transposon TraN protein
VKLLCILLFLFYGFDLAGQVFSEPLLVEVCANKTVSLVFPSNIVSTDRGTDQVILQKAADNILKVKSALDSCRETNLTVVTADGKIYSFIIRYAANPAHLTIHLGNEATVKTVNKLDPLCSQVIKMKPNIMGLQYSSGKVSLQMLGWYVQGQFMFCKLKIENRSQIGYDIEQLRFYLRDNSTLRRTASQEIIQQPLLVSGDTATIKGKSSRIWVVALNKFTIPDDKHFEVEVLEKNGGRHLYIKMNNRQLMFAKEL